MGTICVSLGGSIISKKEGISTSYVSDLSKILSRYSSRHKFIIVVGGGYTCREYITASKNIVNSNYLLDNVGIFATRLNAVFVKNAFLEIGLNVYPTLLENVEDLDLAIRTNDIVVSGGLLEGVTTDGICAIAAEIVKSKILVNISTSGHIYDRHPSAKGAKRLKKISYEKLIKIATMGDDRKPGTNFVFDIAACKIAKRSKIKLHFIGENLNDLENILVGKEHDGTVVQAQ